ncbi:amidohydrolase [Cellulomonas sp. KRMCY2]|uniref:amidohydrolase family protein n=1 Tax=Cellulomonas sp. KRMCY2 TaxID=1304865 RepID=UPI00045E9E71|nr:amidohydrolase family protein [Cellulomonas sp. KRMCY2]
MRVVDAHQHFWVSDAQEQPWRTDAHGALERDFSPQDLDAELDAAGVDATVLMQSVDEPAENDRLVAYARHDRVAGVVSWLPLHDTAVARAELDRVTIDKHCGVRCLIGRDPLEWLTEPPALDLLRTIAARSLVWDVVPVTAEQTRQVTALARAVPALQIVVDHLGRPPVDELGWEPWASHVAELARCPNVAIKVSVGIDALTAWTSWSAPHLARYVGHVIEQFGPQRILVASNWPVVLLRASYAEAWNDLRGLVAAHVGEGEALSAAMGGSAVRWYGLERVGTGVGR